MINRPMPIHRKEREYNPAAYAAVERVLEEMAEDDPSAQRALDAWREGTAMFEEWEKEIEQQTCERSAATTPDAPAPRPKRTVKKRVPRRTAQPKTPRRLQRERGVK